MADVDGDGEFAPLIRQGWLSDQPGALRNRILDRLRLQTFEPGATVYALGDPPGGVYGLIQGTLAVTIAQGPTGPHLAHLAVPGSWFGEISFLTGHPRSVGLETLTECRLAYLASLDMRRLGRSDATMMRAFGQLAAYNLRLSFLVIEDLLISDPTRRIAAVLWRSSGGQRGAEIPVSQAELSRLANASRKYTLSALKQLAALGLVRQGYRQIEVVDPDCLRRFADDDESNA